jgi:DNA polymerase-3 subunit epsilon
VLDTLRLARERFPGQRNSLDALCRRLGVDNGHRKLHGALLDAELLAEVYLSLTAGQGDLGLSLAAPTPLPQATTAGAIAVPAQRRLLLANADEQAAHLARLGKIEKKSGGRLLWPQDEAVVEPAVELELAG